MVTRAMMGGGWANLDWQHSEPPIQAADVAHCVRSTTCSCRKSMGLVQPHTSSFGRRDCVPTAWFTPQRLRSDSVVHTPHYRPDSHMELVQPQRLRSDSVVHAPHCKACSVDSPHLNRTNCGPSERRAGTSANASSADSD
jgi:hypothetical protein